MPRGECGEREKPIHSRPQIVGMLSLICHENIHSHPLTSASNSSPETVNLWEFRGSLHGDEHVIPSIHRPYYYDCYFFY